MPAAAASSGNAVGQGRPDAFIAGSVDELKMALREYISTVLEPYLKMPGFISIGVSGGSMPKLLADVLPHISIDWKRIKIFMVDERMVPHHSPDSNFGQYVAALPKALHCALIPVEMADTPIRGTNSSHIDVGRTALQYEHTLKMQVGPEIMGRLPRFDLVLLGIGPDGHTASLFPNSRLWKVNKLDAMSWMVGVEDSPKPPPKRISLSLPAINSSKNVAFIATGQDKADVIKDIFNRDQFLPASHVKPTYGTLKFFLDRGSSSRL